MSSPARSLLIAPGHIGDAILLLEAATRVGIHEGTMDLVLLHRSRELGALWQGGDIIALSASASEERLGGYLRAFKELRQALKARPPYKCIGLSQSGPAWTKLVRGLSPRSLMQLHSRDCSWPKVPTFEPKGLHEVDRLAEFLAQLNPVAHCSDPQNTAPTYGPGVEGKLRHEAIIHVGSNHPKKELGEAFIAALIDEISSQIGCPVTLTGGSRREVLKAAAAAKMASSDVEDLSGRLDLSGLISRLRQASYFVGFDSGPAHIAAHFGSGPSVTIFLASDPHRWRPWGASGMHVALSASGMTGAANSASSERALASEVARTLSNLSTKKRNSAVRCAAELVAWAPDERGLDSPPLRA